MGSRFFITLHRKKVYVTSFFRRGREGELGLTPKRDKREGGRKQGEDQA